MTNPVSSIMTYAQVQKNKQNLPKPPSLMMKYMKDKDEFFVINKNLPDAKYDVKVNKAWCDTHLKGAPENQRVNNFKLHIAIEDSQNNSTQGIDPNLEQAYDIANPILQSNQVQHYKVVNPGVRLDQYGNVDKYKIIQARKQMTVYTGEEDRELAEWERIMDDIVLSFVDAGIKPKAEFNGEQDVRVRGSSYVTYRDDDNGKNEDRGVGDPYKNPEVTDVMQNLRLSDVLYKKIIDASKKDNLTKKAIILLINDSIYQDGITSANLQRIHEHITKHCEKNEKFKMICDATKEIQLNLEQKENNNHISNTYSVSDYEAATSYSKAAAEYHQLILLVHDELEENGEMPEWWGFDCKVLLLAAQKWQEANQQWNEKVGYSPDDQNLSGCKLTGSFVITGGTCFEKLAVLVSDEAKQAYDSGKVKLAKILRLPVSEMADIIEQANQQEKKPAFR